MNGMAIFLLARFIHVVAGVAWAGGVIFMGWFLLPALRASGPSGGSVMAQLMKVQRLPVYMMSLMGLTILSGLSLFWLDVKAFGPAWVHTGPGITFSIGGALAILGSILGMAVNVPAAKKLGALGESVKSAGKPPTPEQESEMARLQNRVTRMGQVTLVLIVIVVICMGVARYIP
jgi:uncharacterized membrane protein